MQDKVKHGRQLIIPLSVVLNIKIEIMSTIDEKGLPKTKPRITHDQSFNPIPRMKWSINDRVIHEVLTPCNYGKALLHYITCVVDLCLNNPHEHILQKIVDWKAAYWRLHYAPTKALQAITQLDEFFLIALCMTFGGSPNPSQWSDISELSCDLANNMVRHPG